MKRIIVTSALPYANGPIHIGHLAGAYLPADIYTRFQKMMGEDIIYICGTDEHGTPITLQAKERNISPQQVVDKFHTQIKSSLETAGIEFDYFSRTTTDSHYKLSQEFFLQLHSHQYLEVREEKNFFCPLTGDFLADRYVEGECPYCGYEKARGDECSKCGKWLEATKLKNPKSSLCPGDLTQKATKHWYLKLDLLQKELEIWMSEKKHWKKNVVSFVENWFKEGLKPRAITRDLDWGVPVPLDDKDFYNKVLYVWFDAPIGYVSITQDWAKNVKNDPDLWKSYWKNADAQLVHFIGKDNIPFHTIVWPGMLLGQQQDYILPTDVPANEHLMINGEKISSSRGNAVWIEDVIPTFPSDYLRYYLAVNAPENRDSDFSWNHFEKQINQDLVNVVGNLFQRVISFICDRFQGKIDPFNSSITESIDQNLLDKMTYTVNEVKDLYKNFRVKEAVKLSVDLCREGNAYFQQYEPWKLIHQDKDKVHHISFILMQLLESVSYLLYPVMPEISVQLIQVIGSDTKIIHGSFSEYKVSNDFEKRIFTKPSIIFKKVDEKIIQQKQQELNERIKKMTDIKENSPEDNTKTESSEIDIQDFSKVQLRTAKIIAVEKVPKSDKLLKFTLQTPDGERQILSGCAEKVSADLSTLIDKMVIYVHNLKPRKMMGLLSEGMILSAEGLDGSFELLTTSNEVGYGAKIK